MAPGGGASSTASPVALDGSGGVLSVQWSVTLAVLLMPRYDRLDTIDFDPGGTWILLVYSFEVINIKVRNLHPLVAKLLDKRSRAAGWRWRAHSRRGRRAAAVGCLRPWPPDPRGWAGGGGRPDG